jgi:hypothetical protein
MRSIRADMTRFRDHLRNGSIQEAYRALLGYMMDLRAQFKKSHPDYSVAGLYQGYLDMSYFALVPPSFKRRRLKIAIVFNYSAFRFEAWLSGANRQVLQKYWDLVKDARWPEYRLVPPGTWADSILESDLASSPDFADLESLTRLIETKVAKFIKDIERFLSQR